MGMSDAAQNSPTQIWSFKILRVNLLKNVLSKIHNEKLH
jgi:hypothetical protein